MQENVTRIAFPGGLVATLTASAVSAISSSLSNGTSTNGTIPTNGTVPIDWAPPDTLNDGNYFLNTLIGFLIVVAASALNAFGLNVTKLDHTRQQSLPRRERKKEYLRPLWLAGMGMYIVSQIFGSTLALRWLRPDWVAPLGSTSLIFNFLFASWLVGTPVTRTDINGTAVIILGVILILIFSSINSGLQQGLNNDRLDALWSRIDWLVYFSFLLLFTFSTYFTSSLLSRLLASRASYSPLPSPEINLHPGRLSPPNPFIGFFRNLWARWKGFENWCLKKVEMVLQIADDPRITWLQGIGWAVAGGSLAGMCLVFTKAVVKLLGLSGHPFLHVSSMMTLLFVIGTAILQIVCLNRALVCVDTVVVVPLFYAGYTVFGFINSLIFYDEATQYAKWVLVAVFLSIGVLIAGVTILSLKSSSKSATDPYTVSAEPPDSALRMRPRGMRDVSGGSQGLAENGEAGPSSPGMIGKGFERHNGGGDVMWEVGSMSDSDDDGDNIKKSLDKRKDNRMEDDVDDEEEGEKVDKRTGAGGGSARGERRGLLFEEDDGGEGDSILEGNSIIRDEKVDKGGSSVVPSEVERNPFADEGDESFGDFETVEKAEK